MKSMRIVLAYLILHPIRSVYLIFSSAMLYQVIKTGFYPQYQDMAYFFVATILIELAIFAGLETYMRSSWRFFIMLCSAYLVWLTVGFGATYIASPQIIWFLKWQVFTVALLSVMCLYYVSKFIYQKVIKS